MREWYEKQAQVVTDDWALRLLRCPVRRCGRGERCAWPQACHGRQEYPLTEAMLELRVRVLRYEVEERHAAIHTSREADAALRERMGRERKRRQRLALQRARETLGG